MIISYLFNLTIGIVIALVSFVFYLVDFVRQYNVPIYQSLPFFGIALVAATSYVLTFLIGMYLATAGIHYHITVITVYTIFIFFFILGTVYVGASLVAQNMRLEDDRHQARARRVQ